METATKKTKTIRRVELGFIRVDPDETPETALSFYGQPDGSVKLDASAKEALHDPMGNLPGSRAYRIVAEPVL